MSFSAGDIGLLPPLEPLRSFRIVCFLADGRILMSADSLDLFLVEHEVVFDLLTLHLLTLGGRIRVIVVISCPQIVIVRRFDACILILMVFDSLDTFVAELSVENPLCPKITMRLIVMKIGTLRSFCVV